MKVQIVRDAHGKVIGTTEIAKDGEVSVKPDLEKGHTSEEISATDQYARDLGGFYKQLDAKKK
jgi:hypothetical protein